MAVFKENLVLRILVFKAPNLHSYNSETVRSLDIRMSVPLAWMTNGMAVMDHDLGFLCTSY